MTGEGLPSRGASKELNPSDVVTRFTRVTDFPSLRRHKYVAGMATIETYARPITIYRYRSLSGSRAPNPRANEKLLEQELSPIEQSYIYCSTYRELNDPMEGFFKASQRVKKRPDYDETVELIRNQKLALGIASFSETWDNELMWAHYGGAFAGICIGYSVTKLLEGLPNDHALARMAYGDRPYYLGLGPYRQEHRTRAILSTKNVKWSYEREWRLYAQPPECSRIRSLMLGHSNFPTDPHLR